MTEAERYQKRKEYYRQYVQRNKERRAANARRWREKNRERYNALMREHNAKRRQFASTTTPRQPRPPAKPRPPLTPEKARRLDLLRDRLRALKTPATPTPIRST